MFIGAVLSKTALRANAQSSTISGTLTKTALKNSANCYHLEEARNKYKCTQSFADNYSCGEFPRGSVSDVGGGRPLWETTLWLHWSGSQLCKSHSFPCGHLHIQASLFPLPFQHWWPLVPLLWQEQALAVATVTELEIVRPKEMQQLLYGMKHLYVSRRLRFGVLVCFLHLYDRRFTWAVFGVTSI